MTNNARLPGGGEDRVIECPVCSNTLTKMEAEGVTVDVCAGGVRWDLFRLVRAGARG